MSSTHTRVTESRTYDMVYDPVYIGPFSNSQNDPRVVVRMSSSPSFVSGNEQFKYYKRPTMPQATALPPYILLAPSLESEAEDNYSEPVEEAAMKDAEVQTMYRESEAQTHPYTPDYVIVDGQIPEILLLKSLTHHEGLPIGKKELEMIAQARQKQEFERNLPPYTDAASLVLRKRLMEEQEMREFLHRESEIDLKREERLQELGESLRLRNENSEFLAAQRIEAIRQSKEQDREAAFEKLRYMHMLSVVVAL